MAVSMSVRQSLLFGNQFQQLSGLYPSVLLSHLMPDGWGIALQLSAQHGLFVAHNYGHFLCNQPVQCITVNGSTIMDHQ